MAGAGRACGAAGAGLFCRKKIAVHRHAAHAAGRSPAHGGSLRVYAQRRDTGRQPTGSAVADLLGREEQAGMRNAAYYEGFQEQANQVKWNLLSFLVEARRQGKKVGAYGAAAKGNTLLNYAGIRPDLIPYVCDKNPAKQGKFLPGSRIPIVAEDRIREQRPDYVVIFPWNIKDEVIQQLAYVREWGGRFVTAVPKLAVE